MTNQTLLSVLGKINPVASLIDLGISQGLVRLRMSRYVDFAQRKPNDGQNGIRGRGHHQGIHPFLEKDDIIATRPQKSRRRSQNFCRSHWPGMREIDFVGDLILNIVGLEVLSVQHEQAHLSRSCIL